MDGCGHGGGHGGDWPGGEGGPGGAEPVLAWMCAALLAAAAVLVLWRCGWDPGTAWRCVTGGRCGR